MPQDPKNPAWYTWPLPHLRPDAPFVNLPLIDENNKLFYWFKTEPQKFINLQVVSLIKDLYFSKKKQLIEDAHLPCLEFFVQKSQLFQSFEFLHHLESTLENLWVSMAKIDYFHKNSDLIDKTFIIGFFYTEMEYIFINARSFLMPYRLEYPNYLVILVGRLPKENYKKLGNFHLVLVECTKWIPIER